MDRINGRKQGWTTISSPPLPLLAIFAIVIFLLSISQYSLYKERMHYTAINLKMLLSLALVFVIFYLSLSLSRGKGRLGLWSLSKPGGQVRLQESARGMSGFPWGAAVLVVVLLVLVSYQSSFQSKWFPLAN